MKNKHFASYMLTVAGGLMTVSGILIALCVNLAIGGTLWASASCMFFAAYHFRLTENKKEKEEESKDEQETV